MKLELRPRMGIGLDQRMTPQLILLMELLVRPCLELRDEMTAALTDNPALEEVPDEETPPAGSDQIAAAADEARLLEHLDGGVGGDLVRIGLEPEVDDTDSDLLDRIAPSLMGLAEHLLQQLRDEIDDEPGRSIGEWIIGNLDANGYLNEDVSSIAARLAVAPEDVASVLTVALDGHGRPSSETEQWRRHRVGASHRQNRQNPRGGLGGSAPRLVQALRGASGPDRARDVFHAANSCRIHASSCCRPKLPSPVRNHHRPSGSTRSICMFDGTRPEVLQAAYASHTLSCCRVFPVDAHPARSNRMATPQR